MSTAQIAINDFLATPDQWRISLSGTGAVYQLEGKFSALVGHRYAVTVANATSALWAVFMAMDIHDADVITTPYTWGSTLAGLTLAGNRPVFADIDSDTLTLDPGSVVKHLTPQTQAILAVDIYGYPCNGQMLRNIADEHGLALIQDCAQSFGAYSGKHHTGRWADAAVFSFTCGKALFAGEGGVIVTPNEALFDRLVWQTQHPSRQLRDIPHLPINEMAFNLRIHPLSAVWATATFDEALSEVGAHRNRCLKVLGFLIEHGVSGSEIPDMRKVSPSFHVLTFDPCANVSEIEALLSGNDWRYQVTSPPIVEPIYCQQMYQQLANSHGWTIAHLKCAENQCRRRMSLKPMPHE